MRTPGFVPTVVFACCVGAAACAPKTLIVLAPSPDGAPGHATVSTQAGTVELSTPNTATHVGNSGAPSRPAPMDEAAIRDVFGPTMAAMPAAPRHFVLHFASSTTALDAESERLLLDVFAAIRDGGATWVSVVGHADTSGDATKNLDLSTQRAVSVKDRLVAMGAPAGIFDVTSHGENNPLVKTGDNVAEPRNRRVEVVVR